MSEEQKLLVTEINGLPDELLKKIRKYVAELKNNSVINSAPKELIVNNDEELINMINEGYENIEDAISLNDAVAEIENIYYEKG